MGDLRCRHRVLNRAEEFDYMTHYGRHSDNPRLPDFIIAGARKSGTTWLDQCLRQHPKLTMPRSTKELFYFDKYFHRGRDWYSRYFAHASSDSLVGEVTPSYMASPVAAHRMARTLPDVSVALVLRDPAARTWSDFMHAWRKGDVPRRATLPEAVELIPSLLDESLYHVHLERWMSAFPDKDRIRIMILEDFRDDPESEVRNLLAWIGADPSMASSIVRPPISDGRLAPRSHALSAAGHRVARWLHSKGLHRVVSAAKSVGIRQIFLAESGDAPVYSSADDAWLRARIAHVQPTVSEIIGRDLSGVWRSKDHP